MEQHHYLGYEQPVGEHLKYLVWAQGRPIACMAWSSAPRHLGSRDRYIGWSAEARRRNIRFIAYNTRFLILPWIRVPHLASHILGRIASALPGDWERMYSHPVYFAETFIDPGRFRGTCYRAANWVLMGRTTGRGKASNSYIPNRSIKEVLGLSADAALPRVTESAMKKRVSRRRIDVNVDELDRIIDAAMRAPLSETDGRKLKTALHALAERLRRGETRRKPTPCWNRKHHLAAAESAATGADRRQAMGATAPAAFTGAEKIAVRTCHTQSGDLCPECCEGRVYSQKEPKTLIRIVGQAPLKATVFEMERLRCNACARCSPPAEPPSAGAEKFDATAVAMIALLKYGTGMPFNRMERLEAQLGIPLPAATQWELMEAGREARWNRYWSELIRQAAQGGVVHNDDTGMRILKLVRRADDGRTGTFTSGIVSISAGVEASRCTLAAGNMRAKTSPMS